MDAFARGDVAAHKACFADNVVWHVPGKSPVAGDYRGLDDTFAYFDKLTTLMRQGKYQDQLLDTAAGAERVVNIHRISGNRNGKTLDTTAVVIVRE
jgi:ketosteroid isomerase-like protein